MSAEELFQKACLAADHKKFVRGLTPKDLHALARFIESNGEKNDEGFSAVLRALITVEVERRAFVNFELPPHEVGDHGDEIPLDRAAAYDQAMQTPGAFEGSPGMTRNPRAEGGAE